MTPSRSNRYTTNWHLTPRAGLQTRNLQNRERPTHTLAHARAPKTDARIASRYVATAMYACDCETALRDQSCAPHIALAGVHALP